MRRRAIVTIIVGPTTLFRESLAKVLRPPAFRVAASKASVNDLDFAAFSYGDACLLVIEPGEPSGIVIPHIVRFKQANPLGRVAILGGGWSREEIAAAFHAGANAYFADVINTAEFLKAIELIMLGHQTMLPVELLELLPGPSATRPSEWPADLAEPVDSHRLTLVGQPSFHLSARESGILRCLVEGASNKLIARQINISEATVKVHVKAILRKIGATNRTQAAIWAMTHWSLANGHVASGSPSPPELTWSFSQSAYSQINPASAATGAASSEQPHDIDQTKVALPDRLQRER
jgi:two-component system, NarL family, nitrate/nitrite response regulator NarL